MLYVLYALFFIACFVLIGSVLLQPGKTDAGALFTSNVSSTAFAPRGTASVLSKVTIAAAIMFMVSALLISLPALSGNQSVLQSNADVPAEAPATAPADAPPPVAETVVQPGESQQVIIPADTNSNSALIETPATRQFSEDANAAAANSAPANAAPANR